MARGKYEPTEIDKAKVEALSAYGIPQEAIAREIGVAPKTLRRHFRDILDKAAQRAHAKVGEFLFTMASGRGGPPLYEDVIENGKKIGRRIVRDERGQIVRDVDFRACTTAAIFYSKARMGWRETSDVNLTGIPDGAPPVVVMLPDNGRSS
jgi:hypothetical protein